MTRRRRARGLRTSATGRETITYDTGALLAAEAGDRRMQDNHDRLLSGGVMPIVSAVVLAQAWRGGPQPALSRLLRTVEVRDYTEHDARETGAALAASGSRDIVDAAVVVSALARGDQVVSSDPDDLRLIAGALGRSLVVQRPKRPALSRAA